MIIITTILVGILGLRIHQNDVEIGANKREIKFLKNSNRDLQNRLKILEEIKTGIRK